LQDYGIPFELLGEKVETSRPAVAVVRDSEDKANEPIRRETVTEIRDSATDVVLVYRTFAFAKQSETMILITGATGQLGRTVINQLLEKSPVSQIAALVRDENKAADLKGKGVHIRAGNYDDPDALDRAMQGVTKVLLIAGTDEQKRLQQQVRSLHESDAERQDDAGEPINGQLF
jgi:FlaA1/EpsC-like NDP-sugar epimerase